MTLKRLQSLAQPLWPAAALLAVLALAFALGLDRHVSLDGLRAQHETLSAWKHAHPFLAVIVFMSACAGLMAIAFPSVGVLMIAGGYLFGYWGAVWTAAAASLGGAVFFLAVRSAAGAALRARFAATIERLRAGFQRNAFSYLLSLRLLPVMPFVLTSIAGAAAGIRLSSFLTATFLGSLPAAFVYGSIGVGAGVVFNAGGNISVVDALMRPHMMFALLGMAALSAAAFAFRRRGVSAP